MRQSTHQVGTKVVVDGWPWIFTIVGAKFSTRKGHGRKYKLATTTNYAAPLTITAPASSMRPFHDNAKRVAHA